MKKLILLLILLGVGAWVGSPLLTIKEQRKELAVLEDRLTEIKEENRALRDEMKRFNDPDYIEVLARKKLGLVKKGERAFVVLPSDDSESADALGEPTPTADATGEEEDRAGSERQGEHEQRDRSSVKSPSSTIIQRALRFLGLSSETR